MMSIFLAEQCCELTNVLDVSAHRVEIARRNEYRGILTETTSLLLFFGRNILFILFFS
jgi:hypothetical protein